MTTNPTPPSVTLDGENLSTLWSVFEAAITFADEAVEEYGDDADLSDHWYQRSRDWRELRDKLKVDAGLAKDFYDHFTWVENATGDRVELPMTSDYVVPEDLRNRVWTILAGDDGELYPVPGLHYVNREQYCLSTTPWTDEDLETDWVW